MGAVVMRSSLLANDWPLACKWLVYWSSVSVITNNALFRELDMNIYVGNLSWSVSDDELRDLFTEFGEVSSANVIMDKFSGRSKGFGFVEMPDDSDAESAIEALNDKEVGGRNLRVNQAKPREDRPRRPRH